MKSKDQLNAYNEGIQDERKRCTDLIRYCINAWLKEEMLKPGEQSLICLEVIEDSIQKGERIENLDAKYRVSENALLKETLTLWWKSFQPDTNEQAIKAHGKPKDLLFNEFVEKAKEILAIKEEKMEPGDISLF